MNRYRRACVMMSRSHSTAGIVQDPSPCAAPPAGRELPSSGAARTIPASRSAIGQKNFIVKKPNTESRQKIPLELRAKTGADALTTLLSTGE